MRPTLISVFLGLLALGGCNAFKADPGFDHGKGVKYLADGTMILADTPAHWDSFRTIIDGHIERERQGGTPFHTDPTTWNDFWNNRLRAIEAGRGENWPRYAAYIVEARRRAGLPDIRP
jgi:hypothetical protein